MSATATAAGPAPEAAKSGKKSKLLIIVGAAVLLLGGGGAAGWYFLSHQNKAAGAHEPEHVAAAPKAPPAFLPIDSMVVNLADPAGDRMIQLGITLQMDDAKSAEQVKAYMPSIRSAILLLVSQRTSEELLQREGKAKLATAISREVALALGIPPEPAAGAHPAPQGTVKSHHAAAKPANPVQDVLFSSFIIQ